MPVAENCNVSLGEVRRLPRESMRWRIRKGFQAKLTSMLALLAAVSLLALGLWKQRDALFFLSRGPLRYGQQIEPTTLRNGHASVTLGSGRWDVILVDDSGNGLQLSSYLQFL